MAYATSDDFTRLGLRAATIAGIDSAVVTQHLEAASQWADTRLRKRYALPLDADTWGDDLRALVCQRAAWTLLRWRGFDPSRPSDEAVRLDAEDADKLLNRVAAYTADLNIPDAVNDAPSRPEEFAAISTRPRRGW